MRKTRFKPEWKFKFNTIVAIQAIFEGPVQVPEVVLRVVSYQVYNRSNVRYICKNLKLGILQEWDKNHLERYAKVVDNRVATMLYSVD